MRPNANILYSLRTPFKKTRPERMQPSASCDARSLGAEAQTANGCVRHKFSFGGVWLRGRLGYRINDRIATIVDRMCFRLAFSPVLRAADFVLSFSALISFYAIGYIMFCEYRDCMFRSEWLKAAKFKSLVANYRTDWCQKIAKAKAETESGLSRLEHSQCL